MAGYGRWRRNKNLLVLFSEKNSFLFGLRIADVIKPSPLPSRAEVTSRASGFKRM
jgi:hypothetical protein